MQRRFGLFQVINVGGGAVPRDNAPGVIAVGKHPRQLPAVGAVAAQQAMFVVQALPAFDGKAEILGGPFQVIRVNACESAALE